MRYLALFVCTVFSIILNSVERQIKNTVNKKYIQIK